MLPFSFWYAFSLFSTNFLDFQQAWTNFMVLNNGIHWTNSCKSNLELGGEANILDIVFDIDPSDMIVWWLIDFDSSGWYTWICFIFIVELALFSIKALMLANQVLSLSYNSKILWICMLSWVISMFECCPWLPWHLFDYL